MDRQRLERDLARLPVYQYAFIRTDELVISERVRHICRTQCPRYDRTWACPPAVGTLEECRARIMAYDEGLVIATASEATADEREARAQHGAVAREALDRVRAQTDNVLALSAESCDRCAQCTWPEAPCRSPDKLIPCVESHGILVTDLAERCGIPFQAEGMTMWFALILYNK